MLHITALDLFGEIMTVLNCVSKGRGLGGIMMLSMPILTYAYIWIVIETY